MSEVTPELPDRREIVAIIDEIARLTTALTTALTAAQARASEAERDLAATHAEMMGDIARMSLMSKQVAEAEARVRALVDSAVEGVRAATAGQTWDGRRDWTVGEYVAFKLGAEAALAALSSPTPPATDEAT